MSTKKTLTLNEIVLKMNELTGEIEKYKTLRSQLHKYSLLQRFLRNKTKKFTKIREELKVLRNSIQKLWLEYREIELPVLQKEEYNAFLKCSKEYYEIVARHIVYVNKLLEYGQKSYWRQFRDVEEYMAIEKTLSGINVEWQLRTEKFIEARSAFGSKKK